MRLGAHAPVFEFESTNMKPHRHFLDYLSRLLELPLHAIILLGLAFNCLCILMFAGFFYACGEGCFEMSTGSFSLGSMFALVTATAVRGRQWTRGRREGPGAGSQIVRNLLTKRLVQRPSGLACAP